MTLPSPFEAATVEPTGLTAAERRLLAKAMEEARQMSTAYAPDVLFSRAAKAAREATEVSRRRPSDSASLNSLIRADAVVAAAACLTNPQNFPDAVDRKALIAVSNIQSAEAQLLLLSGRIDEALERLMAALENAKAARAYSHSPAFDRTIHALASRAATTAAQIAADRRMSLTDLLGRVESQLVAKYGDMVVNGDLAEIRGFAAVALLRAALTTGDTAYLRQTSKAVEAKRLALTPRSPVAERRYKSDLATVVDVVKAQLEGKRGGQFEW